MNLESRIVVLLKNYAEQLDQNLRYSKKYGDNSEELLAIFEPNKSKNGGAMNIEMIAHLAFSCAKLGAIDMWIDTYSDTSTVELTLQIS